MLCRDCEKGKCKLYRKIIMTSELLASVTDEMENIDAICSDDFQKHNIREGVRKWVEVDFGHIIMEMDHERCVFISPPEKCLDMRDIEMLMPRSRTVGLFEFSGNLFDGIIAGITKRSSCKEYGIDVYAKSVYHGALCVVALESTGCYVSEEVHGQWICLDFGSSRVVPKQYTIKGKSRSWVVEVSEDGEYWHKVHQIEHNDVDLRTFGVTRECEGRFVRLREIGRNQLGCHGLICCAFEVFGSLRYKRMTLECPFVSDPLNGIVAELTRRRCCDDHANGLVRVTSNGTRGRDVSNLLDLDNKCSGYVSENEPGQWICVDFGKRKVRPTHYALRSQTTGRLAPRSWVFEGSIDRETWSELDENDDNCQLDGAAEEALFSISNSGDFRFLRLRMTGKTHGGGHYLSLSALEVFGVITE